MPARLITTPPVPIEEGAIRVKTEFDVFLSYASKDIEHVVSRRRVNLITEVKRALEAFRHPASRRRLRACTYEDDFDLEPEVALAIRAKLDVSSSVLLICTAASANSRYVKLEISHVRATKPADRLLAAIVDEPAITSFSDLFARDTLAANFGYRDLSSYREWKKRLEIECAKVAARVWDVRLL